MLKSAQTSCFLHQTQTLEKYECFDAGSDPDLSDLI